ncbi:MAG: SET domain-containing protein-lysine N-methyltransferase [Simkaniaceae bacterium]
MEIYWPLLGYLLLKIVRPWRYRLKKALKKNDLSYQDWGGHNLLHLSLLSNSLDVYSRLKEKISLDKESVSKMSAAQMAAYLNIESIFQPYKSLTYFNKKANKRLNLTLSQIETRFGFSYLKTLHFKDPAILYLSEKQAIKLLKNPSFEKQNNWTKALYERAFQEERLPSLEIQHVDALIGYGIFAVEPIPELSFIGEYTGYVRLRSSRKDKFNPYIFGYMNGPFDTPFVIDAEKRGNLIRLINHSEYPNCTSRWLILNGICHIILYANRLIEKGEQLTYDYGPHYWRHRLAPSDL